MTPSSILKKTVMALTGLALVGFLIAHLSGNFLLFRGADKFNAYAEFLEHQGGLLVLAEVGLLAVFLLHIYSAIRVTLENKAARPVPYETKQSGGTSTFGSRTMMISGAIIALFIILHVKMFKFTDHEHVDGELWGLVMQAFANPLIALGYMAAMIVLGLHLSHGFSSAFQTLGLTKPGWAKCYKKAGLVVGWLIAIGFFTMPLYGLVVKPKPGTKGDKDHAPAKVQHDDDDHDVSAFRPVLTEKGTVSWS